MILLALDSATPSSVAGVLLSGGRVVEARDDPPPGSRGEHAARLLPLAEQALAEAGVAWEELDRLAVGVGPGGFTGLRIGIATARALAQARGLPLVPVGSLEALAAAAARRFARASIAAVLDARRGEVYAAAWEGARLVLAPAALAPADLAARLARRRRPCGRSATGRYASGRSSRGPGWPCRRTAPPPTGSAPRRSAGSAPRGSRSIATGSSRITAASPTPSHRSDDRPARRRHRGPPPHLRRPPAGGRHRAPRVPDAMVAGDVRARAVQAVRRLPRGLPRRPPRRLPRVLPLRHGVARDERRRRP